MGKKKKSIIMPTLLSVHSPFGRLLIVDNLPILLPFLFMSMPIRGITYSCAAAKVDNAEIVTKVLKARPDKNVITKRGATPLN